LPFETLRSGANSYGFASVSRGSGGCGGPGRWQCAMPRVMLAESLNSVILGLLIIVTFIYYELVSVSFMGLNLSAGS